MLRYSCLFSLNLTLTVFICLFVILHFLMKCFQLLFIYFNILRKLCFYLLNSKILLFFKTLFT